MATMADYKKLNREQQAIMKRKCDNLLRTVSITEEKINEVLIESLNRGYITQEHYEESSEEVREHIKNSLTEAFKQEFSKDGLGDLNETIELAKQLQNSK